MTLITMIHLFLWYNEIDLFSIKLNETKILDIVKYYFITENCFIYLSSLLWLFFWKKKDDKSVLTIQVHRRYIFYRKI